MDFYKKISVIIPVYNTEKYIDRCLKSILSNTYKNIEVICVDDGSIDSSFEVLQYYAKQDKRIRVIKQENAGVSSARNAGLKVVTGEYVTFVDSDDWIHPQYFETLICFQKETNASVVCCMWENVSNEDMKFPCFEKNDLKVSIFNNIQTILNHNVAKRIVCGHLYLSEMVCGHYFENNLKYGEDTFFNTSLICKNPNMTVVVIEKELYYYYKRLTSSTYTINWKERGYLPEKYLEYSSKYSGNIKKIYIIEACKAILAFRYTSSFSPEYDDIKDEYKKIIEKCKATLYETKNITLRMKIVFNIFFEFPVIYRMFRICSDKTLVEWEKRQKEQRKIIHE